MPRRKNRKISEIEIRKSELWIKIKKSEELKNQTVRRESRD